MPKRQVITYLIFFSLLFARMAVDIGNLIDQTLLNNRAAPAWLGIIATTVNFVILLGAFPLIVAVMYLNRDDLQGLHIDKPFMFIFICSGLLTLAGIRGGFNCIISVPAILFLLYILLSKKVNFGNPNPSVWRTSLVAIGIFVISVVFIHRFLNIPKIEQNMNPLFDIISAVVVEEVIYRGLLWMFLRNLNWNESRIFIFQALLFWLSHIHYIVTDPFNFWIVIPAISLLLGYIVLRTKSITPSIIAHLLINFFIGIVKLSL